MTLGQLLRQKRIESGRTLEQISTHTKIHIKILNSIEEDSYAELPARTFTRGFIVNYARALGLNAENLLQEYNGFLESKFNERPNRDQGHQGYAFEGKEIEQNRRWMIIGAGVTVFFLIAVLVIFKPQNHKRKQKHKEFEEVAATSPSPGASTSPSASPTASSSPAKAVAIPASTSTPTPTQAPAAATPAPSSTPKASPSPKEDRLNKGDTLTPAEVKRKISFQAKADIWVRYQVDDLPATTVFLRKGRFLVIKAKESIIFETRHPENLGYRVKGYAYETLKLPKFEVEDDGELEEYGGSALEAAQLPDWIPAPRETSTPAP